MCINKNSTLIVALLVVFGCTTYTKFIQVEPQNGIPKNSKEILVDSNMERILEVLKKNGILYRTLEGGVKTEEFLIDEGTRAQFEIIDFDGVIKVIPYWGITDKVRSEMAMWAGTQYLNSNNELSRVIYDPQKLRPKEVFDYAAQLCKQAGSVVFK